MAMFLYAAACAAPAYGATCAAGYYLDNDECTICPTSKYCPGNDSAVDCPDAAMHKRTTFPEKFYNPTEIKTWSYNNLGASKIGHCRVQTHMVSERGGLYEYTYYNPDTERYDISIQGDWSWGWGSEPGVAAGYYLTTPGMCGTYAYYKEAKECPAGYYCPGKAPVLCNTSNQATVQTQTFGLETCPVGHYCPAGSSAPTSCPVGTYSDTTGATACKSCTNAPQNASYIGNATTNSCPWECDDGYGLHDDACASLCAADMRHLKTGNGLQFNLYRVAYSSPALHVKRNNTVCYGLLAPGGASNAINIKYNGQIYHMTD